MTDLDKLCVYCKNELQIDPYWKEVTERLKNDLPLTNIEDISVYTCVNCKGSSEDEEIRAIEEYNNKFNDNINNRTILNLITCPCCNNEYHKKCPYKLFTESGEEIHELLPYVDYSYYQVIRVNCSVCKGTGYVNNTT